MNKVCLFVGSFDPIHMGHIQSAMKAKETCNLDKLVFLPTKSSPFKTNKKSLLSNKQKVELIAREITYFEWAEVSTLNIELPAPLYSFRTVMRWKENYPNDKLFWLLDSDQWDELEKLAGINYLRENLHFIVCSRNGSKIEEKEGFKSTFIEIDDPSSSTDIRNAVKKQEIKLPFVSMSGELQLKQWFYP